MKSFWALYKKDLRQIWAICLALIVFGIVWNEFSAYAYRMLFIYAQRNSFAFQTIVYWRQAMVFIFPVLLAYQLYRERRSPSVYQTQGLPVSPGMTIIAGFAALCTFGILYAVINACVGAVHEVYHAYMLNRLYMLRDYGLNRNTSLFDWLRSHYQLSYVYSSNRSFNLLSCFLLQFRQNLWYSGELYVIPFYSGMVCLAAGIMGARSRISLFAYWTGFCGILLAVFSVFSLLVQFELDWEALLGRNTILLLAVAFTALGAYLYARYAEV
jgi:hypothetical protein